jgi:hypothetical protein
MTNEIYVRPKNKCKAKTSFSYLYKIEFFDASVREKLVKLFSQANQGKKNTQNKSFKKKFHSNFYTHVLFERRLFRMRKEE